MIPFRDIKCRIRIRQNKFGVSNGTFLAVKGKVTVPYSASHKKINPKPPCFIEILRILDKTGLWKLNTAEKKLSCFDQNLQITYLYASLKDVRATGEAFSSQKRTSST
jgi:hypothetical protein